MMTPRAAGAGASDPIARRLFSFTGYEQVTTMKPGVVKLARFGVAADAV